MSTTSEVEAVAKELPAIYKALIGFLTVATTAETGIAGFAEATHVVPSAWLQAIVGFGSFATGALTWLKSHQSQVQTVGTVVQNVSNIESQVKSAEAVVSQIESVINGFKSATGNASSSPVVPPVPSPAPTPVSAPVLQPVTNPVQQVISDVTNPVSTVVTDAESAVSVVEQIINDFKAPAPARHAAR